MRQADFLWQDPIVDIGEERERIVVEPIDLPVPAPEREPTERPDPEVPESEPVPAGA